jgi:2-amino-4-hydroxy-6-hydroxymethyldihydropteridine diphosphokinase
MEKVVLGLGSNLGRRMSNLKNAVKYLYLTPGFDILAFSSVYETEPWGFKNQNNFLNCAVIGFYRHSAGELYEKIKDIEKKTGRKNREKWHPREIDIDILFFGSRVFKSEKLVVPHPQIRYRNFVLMPLYEIMPDFVHPVIGKKIKILIRDSGDRGKVILYERNFKR